MVRSSGRKMEKKRKTGKKKKKVDLEDLHFFALQRQNELEQAMKTRVRRGKSSEKNSQGVKNDAKCVRGRSGKSSAGHVQAKIPEIGTRVGRDKFSSLLSSLSGNPSCTKKLRDEESLTECGSNSDTSNDDDGGPNISPTTKFGHLGGDCVSDDTTCDEDQSMEDDDNSFNNDDPRHRKSTQTTPNNVGSSENIFVSLLQPISEANLDLLSTDLAHIFDRSLTDNELRRAKNVGPMCYSGPNQNPLSTEATSLCIPHFADCTCPRGIPKELDELAKSVGKPQKAPSERLPQNVPLALRFPESILDRWIDLTRKPKNSVMNELLMETIGDVASLETVEEDTSAVVDVLPHHRSLFRKDAAVILHFLSGYVDVEYCQHNHENGNLIRCLYTLHVARHLYLMRRIVWQNGAAIREVMSSPEDRVSVEKVINSDNLRDQGLSRPRVLIIAPFRSIAKTVIQLLWELLPSIKQVVRKKRFLSEFGIARNEETRQRDIALKQKKPPDFYHLFRDNCDDSFAIGIQLRKTTLQLFTPLNESDLIVASPLGLKLAIEEMQQTSPMKVKKTFDGDTAEDEHDESMLEESVSDDGDDAGQEHRAGGNFLSSIELVVVDRADVIKLQNWLHMREIFNMLNNLPQQVEVDIRRIRHSFASGNSRFLRQTVLFSSGRHAEVSALLNSLCSNVRGAARLWHPSEGKILQRVSSHGQRQIFQAIPVKSRTSLYMSIFEFFQKKIYPNVLSSLSQVLLVIPTYVEFLTLRRILTELGASFACCHEYSSKSMTYKAANQIREGTCKILIMTERYIFFRRQRIRGIRHVVFLTVPQLPEIYFECVASCKDATPLSEMHLCFVIAYYTKYHSNELERIAGSERTAKLLAAAETNFAKLFFFNPINC